MEREREVNGGMEREKNEECGEGERLERGKRRRVVAVRFPNDGGVRH